MLLPQPGVKVHLSRQQAKQPSLPALWWFHHNACWMCLIEMIQPSGGNPLLNWNAHFAMQERSLSSENLWWKCSFKVRHIKRFFIHENFQAKLVIASFNICPCGCWASALQQLAVECLAQGPLNKSWRVNGELLLIHFQHSWGFQHSNLFQWGLCSKLKQAKTSESQRRLKPNTWASFRITTLWFNELLCPLTQFYFHLLVQSKSTQSTLVSAVMCCCDKCF